jgi:hypothetical protein
LYLNVEVQLYIERIATNIIEVKKQIAVIKLDQNISTNIYDAAMEFFVDLRLISVLGVLCGYSLEG